MDQEAYTAVKGNNPAVLKNRLPKLSKAAIEATNSNGLTMLHYAIYQRFHDCAWELLQSGASVNATLPQTGETALHLAAYCGAKECVDLLLRFRSPPSAVDHKKCTPLHLAAARGHKEVVSALLAGGADATALDYKKRSVLDVASSPEVSQLVQAALDGALVEESITPKIGERPPSAAGRRPVSKAPPREQPPESKIGDGKWSPPPERPPPAKPSRRLSDPKRAPVGRVKPAAGAGARGGAVARGGGRGKPAAVGKKASEEGDNDDYEKIQGDLEAELDALIGLDSVKELLRNVLKKVAVDKRREKFGFKAEFTLNTLFLGNPGTGKTNVARIVAKMLKRMKVLSKGHLVEVSRGDLVAEYSGQSAVKTQAKIESALGGVLFVDEAYSLKHEGKDSFGQEAIDTLVAGIENHRKEMVTIMAGYEKEMNAFLETNSGLSSRFPIVLTFPNYTYPEMALIFQQMVTERQLLLESTITESKLEDLIRTAVPKSVAAAGNARAVRNLMEQVLRTQTCRVADSNTVSKESLLTLREEDFETPEAAANKLDVGDVLAKLDSIVGVPNVKKFVRSLSAQIKIASERKAMGLAGPQGSQTLHMIFKGNPGTGKTTIARIVADMFKAMGIFSRGGTIECSRSDLVGEHSGETAPKTKALIDRALGGMLFVDEAYTLVNDAKDSFGREALDTLMKGMEDHRDELVVIFAGYDKEMDQLVSQNPGIKSRFPHVIVFEDYTADELMEIADGMLKEMHMSLSSDAVAKLALTCAIVADAQDPQAGNARFVRNYLEQATLNHAHRLCERTAHTREELTTFDACDLPDYDLGGDASVAAVAGGGGGGGGGGDGGGGGGDDGGGGGGE